MKSKLGLYLISLGGLDLVDYFRTAQPRIAVSMEHSLDTWREVKRVSPNTFIVGRHYVDDSEQIFADDPEGRAEQFFNAMLPYAQQMKGVYDAWMGYNESVVSSNDDAERLSRFYVRWGDLMRAAGFPSCAYSFATGNPELNYWPILAEGLRHCDYLSLHEYSAPTMDAIQTWLCLRYRRAMDAIPADARRPIVITECGIDGGPINRPQEGWHRFTDQAGYLATLQWYDREVQKDDYVIGATIFAANGWGIDGSFGMWEAGLIRDYIAQGGPATPVVVHLPGSGTAKPDVTVTPDAGSTTSTTVPSQLTYTVVGGDTLWGISRKFGVTVAALTAANNISDPSKIKPGMVLVLPTSTIAPVTPVPVPTPAPEPVPTPVVEPTGPLFYTTPYQFPRFNLKDPTALNPNNLIQNGAMGEGNHDIPYGNISDSWEPFVASGNPPVFQHVDNEQIDPGGAQQIFSAETFDAGMMQTVPNLTPGAWYMFRVGYSLAAKCYDGPNVRVQTIGRQVGVDPFGGTDPKSANVIWSPAIYDGRPALNLPQMQMLFVARAERATIFVRAIATDGTGGENRVWFDAICMEPRPEMPAVELPAPVVPTPPQPVAPEPASGETTYTVVGGDTLWGISRKFGVTVAALTAANHISDPSKIRPGQVLTIPSAAVSFAVGELVSSEVEWDARLTAMHVSIAPAEGVGEGQGYWKIVSAQYQDESQAGGNHNVYYTVLDRNGAPLGGVPIIMDWQGREPDDVPRQILTESNGTANEPIYHGAVGWKPEEGPGPYTVWVGDPDLRGNRATGIPGEKLVGAGLPMNRHVNFLVTWQLTIVADAQAPAPNPQEETAPALVDVEPTLPVVPTPAPVDPPPAPQPAPTAPANAAQTYTVQPGDTLWGISRKFGVTVAALTAANNIANPNLIKPGQVLTIPGTVAAPVPPVTPPPVIPQPQPSEPVSNVPAWYAPLPPATRPADALPLRDFPRPAGDNGRGIHFGLDVSDNSLETQIPHLVELGMKWVLLYVGDEMQAEKAGLAVWNAGIMPVIRPKCKIDGKQPNWVACVQALKKNNIPAYIQIYNEPGDDREWNHYPGGDSLAGIFGSKWADAAIQVFDAGGFPGLQILGIEELTAAVGALKASNRTDIWGRAFFALHNYGVNHPPAYPYDEVNQKDHPQATILDDDTAILIFIEFGKWMYDSIGYVLPMIGGEGGWTYGSEEDRRYPKCNQPYHAQFHAEMYNWFRTGLLSNGQPLPDYLFSVAPWILFGFVEADAWYGGPLGDKTETIEAVKAIPPFVRTFRD